MNIRVFKGVVLKLNGFVFLFSLLVFTVLIKLGLWQLDRAAEKDLRLQKMQQYQEQMHMRLNDILSKIAKAKNTQVEKELINDLPVRLKGTFNNEQSFLLDNQLYKGRLGYRVIKIFQDEISKTSVLVNLGWLEGKVDRSFIPEVKDIKGPLTFEGVVRIVEPSIVLVDENLKANNWPLRIQAIDINKISELIEQPLLPFVVYVDPNASLGYIKEWVPIVMSPEKHRGYAFQWFSLALAWMVLMLLAAYKSAVIRNDT